MNGIRVGIIALALSGSLPAFSTAARIAVLPDGSGDFPVIQSALIAASAGDTIELGDGTFTGDGNRDLDFSGKALTLLSRSGNPETCVINCGGIQSEPHRGFDFHSGEGGDSRVQAITVTGAYAADGGIVRCTDFSSPYFANCVFERSEAAHLGGGFFLVDSSVRIEGCYFHFLSSDGGGALWSVRGQPQLRRCTIAVVYGPVGGAITTNDSDVELIDCVISSSLGAVGGAILAQGGTIRLTGCTITDAVAEGGNAAILAAGGDIRLHRCLVTYTRDNAFAVQCTGGTVELSCCDLFANGNGDWVGCIADQYLRDGNFDADPFYCDHDGGDLSLHEGSPCLPGNHPGGYDCEKIGAFGQGCGIVGVDRDLARAGAELSVSPNPFAARSRLRFLIPEAGPTELSIYDVLGRHVRTLCRRVETGGAHEVVWNGENEAGVPSPAGIYFARLSAGRESLVRVIVRIRE
jgi:hypothetical protein